MAEGSLSGKHFEGKIALVPGGSKGIGKATVKKIVQLGGSVCIVARNAKALKEAKAEADALITDKKKQFVETVPADATDIKKLKPLVEKFIARRGVPDYLINCVGYAHPEYVEKLTFADFKRNMEVNYYGQLVPILILLPHFMKARMGHIANVSSMAGYIGVMGYATYTPTKFALVGLSEVLRHELKPYNITVSILYPPDTDTPGLATENLIKPKECSIMTEKAGLLSPEEVAEAFVKGILKGTLHILPGEAKFVRMMVRHFPGLVRWILDGDYRKARKRLGKE
jgi:3-dehydrosphinganine reductase